MNHDRVDNPPQERVEIMAAIRKLEAEIEEKERQQGEIEAEIRVYKKILSQR